MAYPNHSYLSSPFTQVGNWNIAKHMLILVHNTYSVTDSRMNKRMQNFRFDYAGCALHKRPSQGAQMGVEA